MSPSSSGLVYVDPRGTQQQLHHLGVIKIGRRCREAPSRTIIILVWYLPHVVDNGVLPSLSARLTSTSGTPNIRRTSSTLPTMAALHSRVVRNSHRPYYYAAYSTLHSSRATNFSKALEVNPFIEGFCFRVSNARENAEASSINSWGKGGTWRQLGETQPPIVV